MTRDNISYELSIPRETRYANFISYMNLSKSYSKKEIDSLYDLNDSNEKSIYEILGILLHNDFKKLGNSDLINLSKNESEFRDRLVKSMKSKNQNKLKEIFKKYDITLENIKFETRSNSFLDFSPKRFLRLIIQKSDLKIVQFFSRKKVLNEKDMKEFIES